jgi:hypothetical protein
VDRIQQDPAPGQTTWHLVRSDRFDFSDIATLMGVEAPADPSLPLSADVAVQVHEPLEGHRLVMTLHGGTMRTWSYDGGEPDGGPCEPLGIRSRPIDYLGPIGPAPPIGGTMLFRVDPANELFPPPLLEESFEVRDVMLTLVMTRMEDRLVDGSAHEIYEGTGNFHLPAEGAPTASVPLSLAEVWISAGREGYRPLSRLRLKASIPTAFAARHQRFAGVAWDGDLTLEMLYGAVRLDP